MATAKTPPLDLNAPALLPAPDSPGDWPAWRDELVRWRAQSRQAMSYDDAQYRQEPFQWAASAYACGFVFVYDTQFYDKHSQRYTVDALLDQAIESFGGYDAVVLWHAYPRLGFDPRNQFDFYREMPGGLSGLRDACRRFQARGVRVFVNYNPWDTGTRREPGSDVQALAELVAALEADGLFLDTLARGSGALRAALDAVRPGVVLESEGALPLANLHDHHMSWAQDFVDSAAPGVMRNKWTERRHMQHLICRWQRDHTAELHTAWMNGCGVLVWENVFGSWVGWNARDRSLLRAMLPIQRRYHHLFSAGEWTPLVATPMPEVYASRWEHGGLSLWTLVNRSEDPARGALLAVPHLEGAQYLDLIAGRAITPALNGSSATVVGEIGPRGLGAILAGNPAVLGPGLLAFVASQAALQLRASDDTTFPARTAVLQSVGPTIKVAAEQIPPGMVAIPSAALKLQTEFRVRECGFYEPQPAGPFVRPYLHTLEMFERSVNLPAFAIDLTPVTNAQYAEFLAATGYQPEDAEHFLAHWSAGRPPPGRGDHPVVYVDLNDARAYARWAGKRLPTEAEWQYAAQGTDGRQFPWGNTWVSGVCNDGSQGGTTPVLAFPAGRSPFGCYDLCGNVWQWTESEHTDGRTRFCIVRGGSYFKALGSEWYADGGPLPCRFAAKYLLLSPGLDRCATVGFRCVLDLE